MPCPVTDVLVVDPGELGELLSTLFLQYGLSAHTARTGEAALQAALEATPKVVVVDADLPDADGLDIADLLRQELKTRVVITYAPERARDGGDDFRTRLLDADASFARPFRSLALIQEVANLVEESRPEPKAEGEMSALDLINAVDAQTAHPIETADVESLEAIDIDLDVDDDDFFSADAMDRLEGSPVTEAEDDFSTLILGDVVEDEPEEASDDRVSAARDLGALDQGRQDRDALADMFERLRAEPLPDRETAPPAAPTGEGALTPRVLTELLDAFHQSRTSGTLRLVRGEESRALRFAEGRLVAARSTRRSESFSRVAMNIVGPDVAKKIAAGVIAKRGSGPAVARALGVDTDDIREIVLEQLRQISVGAFAWADGTWRVVPGGAAASPKAVSLGIGDIILRGILSSETDEALRQAAPDDARFAPNADSAYRLEELTLSGLEARIVMAVDGTKTVADIHTLFAATEERLRRGVIAGLFRLGVLRFAGWGPAKPREISFF
jgi:CheY-like chemotaxis protein